VSADRINIFVDLSGKKIAWAYFSNNWYNGVKFPEKGARLINEMGIVPFIRMMPRSDYSKNNEKVFTLRNILAGRFDIELKQWALDAKNSGIPLMVEFGTEVNGDWFPWNGIYNGGGEKKKYGNKNYPDGPEIFRDTYRHIIDIFKKEDVNNITWVFHVNSYPSPEKKWNNYKNYYPGDDYIDWIGTSVYGPQLKNEKWQSFKEIMDDTYDELCNVSSSKPIAILEIGVIDYKESGDKSLWISDAIMNLEKGMYPKIKAISWWNESFINEQGYISNLSINSSETSLSAYRNGIKNDIFLINCKIGY
jgi:hypothetical protein